ncbi:substrate-binding domain-containing protein [Flavobacterium sp.]|uniref:PstS family phosphate ABC transporter substrate-binding protein n=1 Tax=Flavobacterium sp. TaxID=239 RepID=UPI002B4B3666|nr:substrate-binding domain-containing protein [Flavobacterium sp.]HLP65600.1 substrate-binding domain-containing protein [Flavobacterium sp.]
MKKYIKYLSIFTVVVVAFVFACAKKENKETILKGTTTILVDETLTPIIEDQIAVFQNEYDAKIKLISQSEKEAVLSLSKGVADVIVLPRKLSSDEEKLFKQKKIVPRTTVFAKDAIAFVMNKRSNDTLISVDEIVRFLKGEKNTIKGLVFDNPNSSNVEYITKLAGLNSLPENGVFSFGTNEEVLKYVASNDGMIGVVGVNWIFQPSLKMMDVLEQVNVLSVKSAKSNNYFFPSQENIATGDYPLARDLYIINCQGYEGLGMGFASFMSGEKGQRIILKSGLAPVRVPGRNIRIRN